MCVGSNETTHVFLVVQAVATDPPFVLGVDCPIGVDQLVLLSGEMLLPTSTFWPLTFPTVGHFLRARSLDPSCRSSRNQAPEVNGTLKALWLSSSSNRPRRHPSFAVRA